MTGSQGPTHALARRVRTHLQQVADQAAPITYKALAEAVHVRPPNRIHQIAEALEHTMREDAANGRPFIAALVISKARGGLPAPGFFQTAQQLGQFADQPSGPQARSFHAATFAAAVAFWRTANGRQTDDVA